MTWFPSPDNPRIIAEVDVNQAFASGSVFSATPEKLVYYLKSLAIEDVPNTSVQHRQIIRAMVINHLQLVRLIEDLDRRNTKVTIALIVIAVASLIASGLQVWAALR